MKHTLIAFTLSFFLAGNLAMAADTPVSTVEQCQNLLNAYGEIQVSAKQAKLTADIQQGIVQVCQKLIEAEKQVKEKEAKKPELK
jgi:hypothetical protein